MAGPSGRARHGPQLPPTRYKTPGAAPVLPHLPARPAAAPGAGAREHVQKPVKRGAFQRAVHLHDQGKRPPATLTRRPRRCYRGQGVLRTGAMLDPDCAPDPARSLTPQPSPSTRRPDSGAHLTGRPPSLLAVQALGPVGQPCTAASGSPSSTGFRTAAMTTAPAPTRKTNYGSREGAPRCARAPASRPRPLTILSENRVPSPGGRCCCRLCCCPGLEIRGLQAFMCLLMHFNRKYAHPTMN